MSEISDAVFNAAIEGIFTIDLQGFIKTVNTAALRLLGYQKTSDLIGRHLYDFISCKHPTQAATAIFLENEVLFRSDRTEVYVDYRSTPLVVDGNMIGSVITFLDNTEKLKNQTELNLIRAWQSSTLRGIGDAVIATTATPHQAITSMNQSAERLTGWTFEEAKGLSLLEIFNNVDEHTKEKLSSPIQSVLHEASTPLEPQHSVLISKDLKEYTIEYSVAPILDSHRNTEGVILVFRDITQEKNLQAWRDNQHRWLQVAIKSIPFPLCMANPDTGEYTYGNDAIEAMIGRSFPVGEKRSSQNSLMIAIDETTGRQLTFDELPSSKASRGEEVKDMQMLWKTLSGNYSVSVTAAAIPPLYGNAGSLIFAVNDITNLIEARRKLEHLTSVTEEDRAKLDAIITDSPIGIALMRGPNLVFEKTNKNFDVFLGRSDCLGRTWDESFGEHFEIDLQNIMSQVLYTGQTAHLDDVKMKAKYFTFTFVRILIKSSEPYGIVIHARETTASVVDQKRLAESERQLAAAVSIAKVGFYDWDMRDDFIVFNDQMKKDWEFDADCNLEEALSRIHPDDKTSILIKLKDSITNQKQYHTEHRIFSKDKKIKWIEAQGRFVFDQDQIPIRMYGTSIEITTRKKSESDRRLLSALVSNSTDFVGMLNTDLKPFYLNDGGRRLSGFENKEISDLTLYDFYPEKYHNAILGLLIPSIQNKGFWNGEIELKNFSTQNLIPVVLNLFPVQSESSNQVIAYGFVMQDISEIKKMQKTLTEAKIEAERANTTKSAFLANMSHEIRTPLGAILGFSNLLKDGDYEENERQSFLETISRNGKALTRIIDDILDLAKVESGKLDIEKIEFSFFELIHEVMDLFRERIRSKQITLNLNLSVSVPQRIVSDPTRIRQILINIVGNAVKFTSQGGVSVNVSSESKNLKSATIKIVVKDTGPGILLENQKKLFEPFMQADNSTTRKFGGTGLGLILSRRLALALGGNVTLGENYESEGSTFVITFQAELSQERKPRVSSFNTELGKLDTHTLKGISVLIVDDSRDNQILVQHLLEKHAAKVSLASGGTQGFKMAFDFNFDVILMDLQMPDMDGYETTRALREAGFSKPIIALTAHAMREERARTREAGCNGHLTKPIHENELVSSILKFTKAGPLNSFFEPNAES